jgi:predicted nucleotidyltransferase
MKSVEDIKEISQQHRDDLQMQFGVAEIGLFGSYVRGEQAVGFFKFLELEEYLEKLIDLKVDLVTKKALKPTIGSYILDEFVPV